MGMSVTAPAGTVPTPLTVTGNPAAITLNDGTISKTTGAAFAVSAGVNAGANPLTGSDVNASGNINHTGNRVGFFNVAAALRTAAWTLVGVVNRVMAALTSVAVATTASTNVAPFGYTTAAQADAIPANLNALRADVTLIQNNFRQLVTDLQTYGLEQ